MADESNIPPQGGEEAADEGATSLRGMGWDILAGGKSHAASAGGKDPFDLETPDDIEADAILGTTREAQPAASTEAPPEEAFWDRGRGAEAPAAGTAGELPARDLRPEELGSPAASGQPAASPTQPVTEWEGDMTPAGEVPSFSFEQMRVPPSASSAPAPRPGGGPRQDSQPIEVPPLGASPGDSEEAIPRGELPAETPTPEGGTEVTPAPLPAIPSWDSGVAGVVSPQEAARVYDPFERDTTPLPVSDTELAADTDLATRLVTQERIDALWNEINETYDLVVTDVRGHYRTTEIALADLKKARELLLSGVDNFDNAEELVKSVKARLRLEEKVRQWSRTRGTWLGVYLVVWLLLLSALSLLTNRIGAVAQQFVPDWMAATFMPGLYGALGGVVGALWVLVKHTARERDFDPIHTPWYVTNPFLGFALGVITYLLLKAFGGLLGIAPELIGDVSPGLYALCVIVGFNQNVLWSLVDRVIKAIIPPTESTPATEQPTEDIDVE
jgi:hypothetical protein